MGKKIFGYIIWLGFCFCAFGVILAIASILSVAFASLGNFIFCVLIGTSYYCIVRAVIAFGRWMRWRQEKHE